MYGDHHGQDDTDRRARDLEAFGGWTKGRAHGSASCRSPPAMSQASAVVLGLLAEMDAHVH
jgi:hypothetical protein